MSNDDFSFAFVADELKIVVACRPSEGDQKILFVTVDGKELESYQYIDKNFGELQINQYFSSSK